MLSTPLTTAEFAALMAPLEPFAADRRIAVAVSGGADSLCLALLAATWGHPLALIADHGMRPESAAEAALTARRLAARGIPSRILKLNLPPGTSQAVARAARHAALAAACAEAGLLDLLLAHHARDQAETLAIRELAHTGPAGRSAMARVTETPDIRLLRPLLAIHPDRLRATLHQAGCAWIDDPSNQNPAYLRARIRPLITPSRVAAAAETCAAAAQSRIAAEQQVAAVLAARATLRPEGFALLSPGPIDPDSLAALLRALTGAPYAPRRDAVRRLAANPRPATLAGIRLVPAARLGPGLLLVREESALADPVPAAPGALWDRRFRLNDTVPPGLMLGALGADAARFRAHARLPSAVLRPLPALRRDGALVAVPHLGYATSRELVGLSVQFRPAQPACGAPFAADAAAAAGMVLAPAHPM